MSTSPQAIPSRSLLKLGSLRTSAPSVSLVCLPFAGGSAHFYQNWQQFDLGHVQGYAIEYPGRGQRMRQSLLHDFSTLIQDVMRSFEPVLDLPYAFFGHSMGALVAFEVTRRLESQGAPPPLHLFLSSCRAPHLPPRLRPWHALPEDELIAEVEQLEGTPPGVFQNQDIRDMMVPVFRADFRMAEHYSCAPTRPINVPISVFGGTTDPLVTPAELSAWCEHTNDFRGRLLLPGGHFYLNDHAEQLVSLIRREITPGKA